MVSQTLNTIKYWRNTLADAARIEIATDKVKHVADAHIDVGSGKVDTVQANQLIDFQEISNNESKGIENREHEDWETIEQVPVLISLFRVAPVPEYVKYTNEKGVYYPFWIRAVLDRSGNLKLDDDTFPYIPRTYLEPQENNEVNFTFGHVDKVDEAFANTLKEKDWTDYWKYLQELFKAITDQELNKYRLENFSVYPVKTIVLNNSIQPAADGIIKLYDYLIREQPEIPLLNSLSAHQKSKLQPVLPTDSYDEMSLSHLGQMGSDFPLSFSQRRTLYHFNTGKKGKILAVNGPPGTGKTTLLQSVVANEVVKSALKGTSPGLILACSTNNQAVTNITDSFSNIKGKQGIFYERWLPGVESFALYLPAKHKKVKATIHSYKQWEGGFPTSIENEQYLQNATNHFIACFNKSFLAGHSTVEEITTYLRNQLSSKKEELEDGIEQWKNFRSVCSLIPKLGGGSDKFLDDSLNLNESELKKLEGEVTDLESRFCDYVDREIFWIKLFSFLKPIKQKRAFRLKQLFRGFSLDFSSLDFYNLRAVHSYLDTSLNLIKEVQELNMAWLRWKEKSGVKGNPPLTEESLKISESRSAPYLFDELEVGVKNDMFFNAVHYWEGRWLMEVEEAIFDERLKRNGEKDAQKRWERFAMIFPCFISTFYMAPKFFTFSKFIKKTNSRSIFETPPLLELIDLLIVDEASQVSPEVGAATFALAKKALVVGDTQQIEPVWNVPQKVDVANLNRYGLVSTKEYEKGLEELYDNGFLGSSGSIMKLAQKASEFQINTKLERGMLLTEHRRCNDEIIGYCNKLAYQGILEPKKGPAKDQPLIPMSFIHNDGDSVSFNSSRVNKDEAEAIAKWLKNAQLDILNHYQEKENQDAAMEQRVAGKIKLSDVIGVVTPFTAQKWAIKSALKSVGLVTDGMTIGTVHALQGAERNIILFSSVYGKNNEGSGYFFDKGVNMLNVAVSRAKDSFVMFGHENLYVKAGKSPSQLLYKYIKNLSMQKGELKHKIL